MNLDHPGLTCAQAQDLIDHYRTEQMKHNSTFTPYHIQPSKRFARHWQIEWEGCDFAARGWTKSGCIRRGTRWRQWDANGRPFGLTWIDWKLCRMWWWAL